MRKLVCTLACAMLVSSVVHADDKEQKKVLTAWKDFQTASKEAQKISSEAIKKYQEAVKEGKDRTKAANEFRAATAQSRAAATTAMKKFAEAFAASDWSSFDAKENSAMLQAGLPQAAQVAMKNGKMDLAQKAFETLIKKFPKAPSATSAQLTLGDILAVQGKVKEARKAYEAVADGDNARYKQYAAQRLLIGKDAPEIASEQWIGAKAQRLSQLRGKVVVVDFWATWCGPCRVVMPGLSELYKERKKDGLVVMGVTRFYTNGYMPANPKQMLTGGKSVRNITEKEFPEHVKAFRDNTKLAYPMVIGAKENFTDYRVLGIPSVAVINAKGKIALLAVGSGSEPLVRAAVERELKNIGK